MLEKSLLTIPLALNADDLALTQPERQTNSYFSYVTLKNQIQFVQTNNIIITDLSHTQVVVNSLKLAQFIKDYESLLCDYIHKHSTTLFNGKKFSLQKIQDSLVSLLTESSISLDIDSPMIRDQYETEIKLNEVQVPCEALLLLHLEGIRFTSTKIIPQIKVHQIKVHVNVKIPWSIITTIDDFTTTEEPLNELLEAVTSEIKSEVDKVDVDGQVDDEKNLY
jgi:hypothetical protein